MHISESQNVPSFALVEENYLKPKKKYDLVPLGRRVKRPIGILAKNWPKKDFSGYDFKTHMGAGCNIGVRPREDQLVIDADPRNYRIVDGKKVDEVALLSSIIGFDLMDAPHVETGGGGFHFHFDKPGWWNILKHRPDLFGGIEFKSLGDLVVSAGSLHDKTGKMYVVGHPFLTMAHTEMAPQALLDLIKYQPNSPGGTHAEPISSEKYKELLCKIDPAKHRADWLALMMACHEATDGEGKEEFISWSVSDNEYIGHEGIIEKRWESLSNKEHKITRATLYSAVMKAGYPDLIPQRTAEGDFSGDPLTPEDMAGYKAKAALPDQSYFLSVSELKKAPPPTWLVRNLIQKGSVGFLYGAPSSLKSFLALHIGACVSLGRDIFPGMITKKAKVFLIVGEGQSVLGQRIGGWEIFNGQSLENIKVRAEPVFLNNPKHVQQFLDNLEIAEGEDSLIIVDTFSTNFSGNENTDEVVEFMRHCFEIRRKANATVLIVHHTGKNGTKGLRGHSALLGGADFSLFMEKKGDIATVKSEKFKDAPDDLAFKVKKEIVVVDPNAEMPSTCALSLHTDFSEAKTDRIVPPYLVFASAVSLGNGHAQKMLVAELVLKASASDSSAVRAIRAALPMGKEVQYDALVLRRYKQKQKTIISVAQRLIES